MNKKVLLFAILSILLVSMFAGIANAQQQSSWDKIKDNKLLRYIFYDLNAGLQATDKAEAVMMIRIIFFILVFAILFGVSELVLKDLAKGSRIAIAIALALISSVGMPKEMLLATTTIWGGSLLALCMIAPMFGLIYLAFAFFKKPERTNYIARTILFGLSAYLASIVGNTDVTMLGTATLGGGLWGFLSWVFFWVEWIFWILFIYYLYKSIAGVSAGARAPSRSLKEMFGKVKSVIKGEELLELEELKFLKDARAELEKTPPAADEALKHLAEAAKIDTRAAQIDSVIDRIERRIEHLEEKDKRRFTTRIDTISREIRPLFLNMRSRIIQAEGQIKTKTARGYAAALTHIKGLINWDIRIVALTKQMMQLEEDLTKRY
jgi:hypothetical protein